MSDFAICSVTERDVDLLLLEEFVAAPSFAKWFANIAAGLTVVDGAVLAAQRSVTTSVGESDLEVALAIDVDRVHYLLIENKVTAGFQPRQAERYRDRGETYTRQGECVAYTSVLVAPEKYLGQPPNDRGFDATVTYEAIQCWFDRVEESGQRSAFKRKLLAAAIDKSTSGYQPLEDRPVTEFWRAYWSLTQSLAPELEMSEPISKPAGAGFVWFRPSALPRTVTIVHKLPYGNVDLQFAGMGASLTTLHERLGAVLEPDMSIARANKSGAVRLRVPIVDTTVDFAIQAERVKEGIGAAERLLDWYARGATAFKSSLGTSPGNG